MTHHPKNTNNIFEQVYKNLSVLAYSSMKNRDILEYTTRQTNTVSS
jgi:hypothetical protein